MLDLQTLDATLDQFGHQLTHLPEQRELDALAIERAEVDDAARDARILLDDLTREQRKADTDVEQVKTRLTRDQTRMDQGLITNPKDLERMQSELVSLARRISDLEDLELEVMERVETAQADHDELTAQLRNLDERTAGVTERRDDKLADLRQRAGAAEVERTAKAEGVAEDLLALYEKIRTQKGGVGAAALHAHQCRGCSLELTASDLGRIAKAPTDEVLRCEECNRILVRTPESGV